MTRREDLARRVIDGRAELVAAWGRAGSAPASKAKVWSLYVAVILTGFFGLLWWMETSRRIETEHTYLRHGVEAACLEQNRDHDATIKNLREQGSAVYNAVAGSSARKRASSDAIREERIQQVNIFLPKRNCAARVHLFTK